jgi:hypothetical protein
MAKDNPYSASQVTESGQPWIRTKLGVMMFLQIAIWGAWLPSSYGVFQGLGFSQSEQTWLAECFPIAAIIAMFAANQWVDRHFAAEKFLAFSQLIGGLAILAFGWLARQHFQALEALPVGEKPPAANYWLFFGLMAVHCFFYVPTMTVTNKIAFANLKNPAKDFGPVRLWGTIGWIAVAWPFVFILTNWILVDEKLAAAGNGLVERLGIILGTPVTGHALNVGRSWAFIVAGGLSLLLAAFSLTLPHTPPKKIEVGENRFAWLESLHYLKKPFILILFIVTWIDATVHDGFFVFAFDYLAHVGVPSNWVLPAMTIGQIAEILTMAILGMVLKRFGWRWTLIIGILGHAARFAVFAYVPDPYAAVAINLVHGICYAFFFATVYIFVDEVFPADARASAQGLFNLLIFGLGPITARFLWPAIRDAYKTVIPAIPPVPGISPGVPEQNIFEYQKIFLYPSGLAVIAACMLMFLFHPPTRGPEGEVKH